MIWLFAALFNLQNPHCPTCHKTPSVEADLEVGKRLLVFMSFSAPVETWKDLSSQLEKTDGVFVVRGVPENSFEAFAKKVVELRQAGVGAPIDIDPEAFETYAIDRVPAIVLEEGTRNDKVVGNVRLDAALIKIKEMGDAKDAAEKRLAMLESE